MSHPFLLLACAACAAAVEVEPAKLATADAAPLDPGSWEVALGGSWTAASRARDAQGDVQERGGCLREIGAGLGITYGLVEGLDAGLGIGWTRIADAAAEPGRGSGPTDLELGAKWRFAQCEEGEAAWAVALLPALTAPLGRGQRADERIPTASRCWTAGLALAVSGSLGPVALNADAGWVRALGGAAVRDGYRQSTSANLALGVQVAESVQPEVELNWSRDEEESTVEDEDGGERRTVDEPWTLAVTAGVQLGLPIGRLGLGVQRTVAGALADDATTALADLAISF